jgi:Asp-tRNA(Asn)/Glu-tRNA(Gln) amidotransferase C subunit
MRVEQVQSVERLRELSKFALDAATLEEFTQALETALAES